MEIKREMVIQGVEFQNCQNVPFKISLRGKNHFDDEKATLSMDKETSERHKIPWTPDLVKKSLVCTFRSVKPPVQKNGMWAGTIDYESVKDNGLQIKSVERREAITTMCCIPPGKHTQISQTLILCSFGEGDGTHPPPIPCPFYQFELSLTDKEYQECKKLTPVEIMEVNFKLL